MSLFCIPSWPFPSMKCAISFKPKTSTVYRQSTCYVLLRNIFKFTHKYIWLRVLINNMCRTEAWKHTEHLEPYRKPGARRIQVFLLVSSQHSSYFPVLLCIVWIPNEFALICVPIGVLVKKGVFWRIVGELLFSGTENRQFLMRQWPSQTSSKV